MMTNKGLKVVVGIGLMLGAGVVLAQDPGGEIEAGKRWLAAMNHKGDTDNTISHAEFNKYMDAQFRDADVDHDGTLNAAELGHLRTMLIGK